MINPQMTRRRSQIRPGDLVEVKSPQEIAATLDEAGTIDQLPFMREMVEYCGRRFRVSQRVVKVCASGMKTGWYFGEFRADDVMVLDGLRCSGADHDGCQKACTIFWREAWLRKVENAVGPSTPDPNASDRLRARLKTSVGPNTYFCQASELLRATRKLTRSERYSRWVAEMRSGNCGLLEMARRITIWGFWKARWVLFGPYGAKKTKGTPTATLNLQPGELVQVKPLASIFATLDEHANNRGLWFSPNMRLLCGQQRRVERRIDKLIVDGSGEMRTLKNTVFLEGSHCGCAHIAFGGCSRGEFVYWREAWLHRPGDSGAGMWNSSDTQTSHTKLSEYAQGTQAQLGTRPMTNEFHHQNKTNTSHTPNVTASGCETEDGIETRLCQIWQELLGIDSVGLDDNYFDLGGDSALTIQLFAQVEKIFTIRIPLPMLFEAPTVREFAQVLRRAGAWRGVLSLVPIQPAGSRPPLFCIHGLSGDVSIYRDLSHYLSHDQPFYGLQSRGLDGKVAPLTTINEMAALYLKEIRELQPRGPYFLGGHVIGGAIALEVAQQLQKTGEVVGLVALFDTIDGSNVSRPSLFRRVYHRFQQWRRNRGMPPDVPVPRSHATMQVWDANCRASSQYAPQSYGGAVAVFRPSKQYWSYPKPEMKWDFLARGTPETVVLPVDPTQMLMDPFVKHLAAALTTSLETAMSKAEFCRAQLV